MPRVSLGALWGCAFIFSACFWTNDAWAKKNEASLLSGIWIDPTRSCEEVLRHFDPRCQLWCFEDFDGYAIYIAGGVVYGLENNCRIRSTKRNKVGEILALADCDGEGEHYTMIARYNPNTPNRLIAEGSTEYKKCRK